MAGGTVMCINWAAQLLLESPSSVKVRLLPLWLATPTCDDGEGKLTRTAVGEISGPPMSHHSVRAISRSCVFWCWLQVCVNTSAWCYRLQKCEFNWSQYIWWSDVECFKEPKPFQNLDKEHPQADKKRVPCGTFLVSEVESSTSCNIQLH